MKKVLCRFGTRLTRPSSCRQESAVQRFEQDNNVASRWEPSMEEYKEALKIAGMSKQQGLKQQMMDAAKERMFYVNTLVHHAGKVHQYSYTVTDALFVGGQKQANRVSKLIQACSNKVKKLLSEYCELQVLCGDTSQSSVKDVCNLQSHFWQSEHSYFSMDPHEKLPASSQRRLLELCSLRRRASEEKEHVISDLFRTFEFYGEQLDSIAREVGKILDECEVHTDVQNFEAIQSTLEQYIHCIPFDKVGLVALLLTTAELYQQRLNKCERTTQLIVSAHWMPSHATAYLDEAKKNESISTHFTCPISVQETIDDYIQEPSEEIRASYWDVDTSSNEDADSDSDMESITSTTASSESIDPT